MTNKKRMLAREALDVLALALASKGHTWTAREREAYESAIRLLG